MPLHLKINVFLVHFLQKLCVHLCSSSIQTCLCRCCLLSNSSAALFTLLSCSPCKRSGAALVQDGRGGCEAG